MCMGLGEVFTNKLVSVGTDTLLAENKTGNAGKSNDDTICFLPCFRRFVLG